MSPSAELFHHPKANTASRRVVSPPSGSTAAPGVGHPAFEDFMNAYRPTLEVTNPKGEKFTPKDDTKPDFGKSIKRLMKRGQASPVTSRRTPLESRERSITHELRPPPAPIQSRRAVRPSSVILESGAQHSPAVQRSSNPHSPVAPIKSEPLPSHKNSTKVKTEKAPSSSSSDAGQRPLTDILPVLSLAIPLVSEPSPGSTKRKIAPLEQLHQQQQQQQIHLHSEKEVTKVIQTTKTTSCPNTPGDSYCLFFTKKNLERFLPSLRNPDVLLTLPRMEIPNRKYRIIMEFNEGPQPQVPKSAPSGLQLQPDRPEEWEQQATWEQTHTFSMIRDSRIACFGMLLINVQRWTEFPFMTYLVVGGDRTELSNRVHQLKTNRPPSHSPHMHFISGYDETVTLCRPPLPAVPEPPTSGKSGYVVSLYQVLESEDGLKFEQNWGTWTGARHLFLHAPEYMGLKRISMHKSILPSSIILYAMICEFSTIMDYLTEACVLIDQIRARCCGFIGIYRVLDSL